jgi:hypothetical protein
VRGAPRGTARGAKTAPRAAYRARRDVSAGIAPRVAVAAAPRRPGDKPRPGALTRSVIAGPSTGGLGRRGTGDLARGEWCLTIQFSKTSPAPYHSPYRGQATLVLDGGPGPPGCEPWFVSGGTMVPGHRVTRGQNMVTCGPTGLGSQRIRGIASPGLGAACPPKNGAGLAPLGSSSLLSPAIGTARLPTWAKNTPGNLHANSTQTP